jgi:lysophospholipase L1-like esterase
MGWQFMLVAHDFTEMHTPTVRAPRSITLALLLLACSGPAFAQAPAAQTRWYLAEGATGSFEEEILIGNPNATAADIKITYLQPGGVAPVTQTFSLPATSRYTVKVNTVPGLASVSAVSAVVESLNGVSIVVERSMYWAGRQGGHNSQAVAAPAVRWFLAEGSTGAFDTFVLIANSDAVNAADVQVTFLSPDGTSIDYPRFSMPPGSRTNIWVNAQVPALANKAFSTVVESMNGTPVFVERAMYFGAGWEGGHESMGVTAAGKSWFFGEGYTGGSPTLSFDTFLLLANPGTTPATATVTFLLEGAPPVVKTYPLLPTSRENVWVDRIPGLGAAPFSMRVESDQPIVAERAMYWGPATRWLEGHNVPGVTSGALAWAFAEGAEDGLDTTGLLYDTYFLLANPSTTPLSVRATFVREDGTGVVRTFDIPRESRFTLPTGGIPELSNQRFSAFFEATNGVSFVAERAMYWGEGYFGGHASAGTPWTGAVATPPTPPLPLVTSVVPSTGSTTGGAPVTVRGTDFRAGSTVTFGGAAALRVVVLNSTTITAITPAGLPGTVDVAVTAGTATTSLARGFSYVGNAPTIAGVSPGTGPTTGGTTITITGTNLSNVMGVAVGGVNAASVTVVDASTVRAVTPPHASGLVGVSVTTGAGFRADAANAFTYVPAAATDILLAFGDSITYGTSSRLSTDANGTVQKVSTTVGQPYPALLRTKLAAQYPAQSFAVTNSGVPGECASVDKCSGTESSGVVRLPKVLTPQQDLVVIQEGVNDLNQLSGRPDRFDRIIRNLRSMVQAAKGAGKKVTLGTLTPVKAGEDLVANGCSGALCYRVDRADVSTLNGRIRMLASEESVVLVDFETAFGTDGSLLSPDGLHPNEAGYDRMAQRVSDSVRANFETIPPVVP